MSCWLQSTFNPLTPNITQYFLQNMLVAIQYLNCHTVRANISHEMHSIQYTSELTCRPKKNPIFHFTFSRTCYFRLALTNLSTLYTRTLKTLRRSNRQTDNLQWNPVKNFALIKYGPRICLCASHQYSTNFNFVSTRRSRIRSNTTNQNFTLMQSWE